MGESISNTVVMIFYLYIARSYSFLFPFFMIRMEFMDHGVNSQQINRD